MKIDVTVIGIEDVGAEYRITTQGWERQAPDGAMARRFEFKVDARPGREVAFGLGRKLTITIEPKRGR